MIRNINNSISNSPIGPIAKPLVAGATHDIMGNSLGPTVQLMAVETLSSLDLSFADILVLDPVDSLTSSSSFSLGGENYTVTYFAVCWIDTSGGQGDHTYLLMTAPNDSTGANIQSTLVGQDLGETVGVRIAGSGGSEDFYPLVIGSGSDFEWKNGGVDTDIVLLRVNSGIEMVPFSDGSQIFESGMGNGNTDEITISLLT
tara:strand:+ start:1315 stop:1917 length:603 start_codon:yes stop_codon:yes gene_type:complete